MANGTIDLQTIYDDVEALTQRVAALENGMIAVNNAINSLSAGAIVLESGADLHTLNEGDYIIPNAAVSATILNKPITNNLTARVKVINCGDEGQKSIYFIPCVKSNPTYYHAAYYQGNWGAWNIINLINTNWTELPLINGAEAYSEAQKPCYKRVGNEVFLSGVFKGVSASDTQIATLPVGFRPSRKVILTVAAIGQKIDRIEILADGVVRYNRSTIEPTTAENWHSIACNYNVD